MISLKCWALKFLSTVIHAGANKSIYLPLLSAGKFGTVVQNDSTMSMTCMWD